MEETTVENIEDSMKYYCRVCTSNTKSKKFKPDDSIAIFKRTGLKSVLEKYLQLQISEDDPLPKVICKVCFDKIEAIEFLRVIARRTETLLRDYLKNKQDALLRSHNQFQNEFNSFAITQSVPPALKTKRSEVVVNVSVSNPLTKDINKKLQVAQRKKASLEKAFNPKQVNRVASTSTPNAPPPPVTIVHQMPRKKLPLAPQLLEKRKNLQIALTNATTVTLENPPPPAPEAPAIKLPERQKLPYAQPPPLRPISDAPPMTQKVEIHPVVNTHTLGHGLALGSIIKDEDLLKLILKALKWPFNNQTLGIQIQRLKNTNFSDVIVDPNLLQDADLLQILGPLIHPTLVPNPLPTQQSYHISIPPEPMPIPPSTISYKLPAETSVQIITVPVEEKASRPKHTNPRHVRKRPRYTPIAPKPANTAVIVVSDESEDEALRELSVQEEPQHFEVQLDPAMYPGIGESSNSNEAMLATLNRQREAMMRVHRNKRKQSHMGKNVEMVDDIMIVDEGVQMTEEYPEVVLVKKPRKPSHMASTSTAATVVSPAPIAELPRKIVAPPTAPALAPQIPPHTSAAMPPPLQKQALPKLPMLPVAKLPILPPNIRKVLQRPRKLPVLKTISKPISKTAPSPQPPTPPPPAPPSTTSSQYYMKNTTLADADSTTKIVIKETKVPKPPSNSKDIEDQIIKVRIGKQKPVTPTAEDDNENDHKSSSDDEVLIVVEYEDEDGAKETQAKNDKDQVAITCPKATVQQEDTVDFVCEVKEGGDLDLEPVEVQNASNEFEMPAIEIKEEEEDPETVISKDDIEVKEEKTSDSDDKRETTELPKTGTKRSFVASRTSSKTDAGRQTRSRKRPKAPGKPKVQENPKAVVTTFRPARRSKTLSKYYKGPPAPVRSMRSRT